MNALFKTVLGIAALALAPAFPAVAQEKAHPYKIVLIRDTHSADLINVGRNWRKDLPKRIQVTLRVAADTPASKVKVKGYFYDKENNLVYTAQQPNPIWTRTPRGVEEVGLPATLKAGKPIEVYFALPEEVTEKKWKTLLVVFGDSSAMVARSRPAAALDKLSFPESKLVTASD